jgi:hypothetical protein
MQAICKRARFPEVCPFPHTIHKAQIVVDVARYLSRRGSSLEDFRHRSTRKTQRLYPGHGMLMDVDMHSTLPCSGRLARRLHRL